MKPKNEMTIENCKMAFPKAAWFAAPKSKTMRSEAPEASLQKYANDAITLRTWSYLRFPDGFMRWMKVNAPPHIQKIFFGQVAGRMPDNLVLTTLGQGMFLATKLELKTQDKQGRAVGRLHGKQKRYARAEGWQVARSPEQINRVLNKIEATAKKIKNMLTEQPE